MFSDIFVADTKIIFRYGFVTPLKESRIFFALAALIVASASSVTNISGNVSVCLHSLSYHWIQCLPHWIQYLPQIKHVFGSKFLATTQEEPSDWTGEWSGDWAGETDLLDDFLVSTSEELAFSVVTFDRINMNLKHVRR